MALPDPDEILDRSPGDDMFYDWDFSDEDVFALDPITLAVVTNWDDTPLSGTLDVDSPVISSPIVQTRIYGGTDGVTDYLKCKATNASGRDREAYLKLYTRRRAT